jgi:DNA-binding response OmpR family regulator
MAMESPSGPPVVLLVEPSDPKHHHAEMLTRAGFRVVQLPPHEVTTLRTQDVKPAIVAVELDGSGSSDALDLAPRLRREARPRTIPIPVIVYGHGLSAADIERAAMAGAMWLQLEPSDGAKLVAAIRGVLTADGVLKEAES